MTETTLRKEFQSLDELYSTTIKTPWTYPMISPIFQPYISSNIHHQDFKLPTIDSKNAIGAKIYMLRDTTIKPESYQIIDSGLKLKHENIPPRHYIQLVTKGNSYSILIHGSSIDPDFKSEIFYTLHNPYKTPTHLRKGTSYVIALLTPYYPQSTQAEAGCTNNYDTLLPWKHSQLQQQQPITKKEVRIFIVVHSLTLL